MSEISEQVKKLREYGNKILFSPEARNIFKEAADTMEALSAKVATKNIERSQIHYDVGWVECDDRLPITKSNILICQKDGYVSIGYYSQDKFLDLNSCPFNEVIAWQPLPEPYRHSCKG